MQRQLKPSDRFGRLTIVSNTGKHDSRGNIIWLCLCDCGNYVEKSTHYLVRKTGTHSCGCQRGESHIKHGDGRRGRKTRLYRIWCGMLWRCNPKNHDKYSYAKNGISVCDEWLDYEVFSAWALKSGYTDDLTIDRIDYNGNYEPSNCRWITRVEQANNKSNNHLITYNGKTMTLAEWARELGINYSTLRSRINRQKLSPEKAFSKDKAVRDPCTGRFVGGYDAQVKKAV